MKTSKAELVPMAEGGGASVTLGQQLCVVAAQRAEEILAEVAPTLRRLRTFLLAMTITIPLFLAGLVVVLWHLAR